jgi:hypothetical protein
VEPQGAEPALRLVLGRVGERHRGSGEGDYEGRVLGERGVPLRQELPPCVQVGVCALLIGTDPLAGEL